jgi:hypothetical protein
MRGLPRVAGRTTLGQRERSLALTGISGSSFDVVRARCGLRPEKSWDCGVPETRSADSRQPEGALDGGDLSAPEKGFYWVVLGQDPPEIA